MRGGGAQFETTHTVVSNLYNNLGKFGGAHAPGAPRLLRLCSGGRVPGLGCAEDVGSTVLLSVGTVDFKIEVGREESIQYHLHLLV